MATDEEKCKIAKLLQSIDVPDLKISERGVALVREFERKYGSELEEEAADCKDISENPYVPDKELMDKNETKLRELRTEDKRSKKSITEGVVTSVPDPKRPWRTNSSKERLLRIDGELKRHIEKASQAITPMNEVEMQDLVEECRQEINVGGPVGADRLRETVDQARKNLPHFQYRKINNSTAISIFPTAHHDDCNSQHNILDSSIISYSVN